MKPRRTAVKLAIGALLHVSIAVGTVYAQTEDFRQPQVVLATGGHQAPPRAIVFAPDQSQMLSAGFDKVVFVWDLDEGRPRLASTLRPPIWRGAAGRIYAMALAPQPVPGDPKQRYLALAGYGVTQTRGNIALYRYPGSAAKPTGDLVAQLPVEVENEAQPRGHSNTVMGLAFSPDGRWLVSAGLDGHIIVWDVAKRTALRITENVGRSPINALAISGDGARVVTGDAAGHVRIWDFVSGKLLRSSAPLPAERGKEFGREVLCLGINPRGPLQWIIAGHENGYLGRYDAGALARTDLLAAADLRGPIDGLAIAPDGARMAVSRVAHPLGKPGDLPQVDCLIELRAVADGRLLAPNLNDQVDNLVHALAFSPDGRYLAYGGGNDQALRVRDLQQPAVLPAELRGVGRSVWDVGWSRDSRSVGFGRVRPDQADVPNTYEAFDLFDLRLLEDVPRADLATALKEWNGYRVRPIDLYHLALVDPQGVEKVVALDPNKDRRWWCYTFVPPEAKSHDLPTLAVGCESGIAIFDVATGRRNRLYAGHGGPVYAVAPSPDHRWLASGSSDQTVRIWRLKDCDKPAAMGFTARQGDDQTWRVATVEPMGFSDQNMLQLKAGDVIEEAYILREGFHPKRIPEFLERANALEPNTTIQMVVRRDGQRVRGLTTKRDSPLLALYVGLDREWVVWMPRGYYETSIAGDHEYLFWHRNGARADLPTEIFPADQFEAQLRLPNVLKLAMNTGDLAQALAAVPAAARDPEGLVTRESPPLIELAGLAGWAPDQEYVTNNPVVTLTPNVTANDGRSLIRSIRVLVGERLLAALPVPPGGVATWNQPVTVTVPPGENRVTVEATNVDGRKQTESVDMNVTVPAPRPPKLAILSIGVKGPFEGTELKAIPFADLDAEDVLARLEENGKAAFGSENVIVQPVLADAGATSAALRTAIEGLLSAGLGQNDTLIVQLESHFVASGTEGYFVGSDAGPGAPPAGAIPSRLLADALVSATQTGCRVMLLVDAVHEGAPSSWANGFKEWARDLFRRGVMTFIASNRGPSQRNQEAGHGAFALGVIEGPTARGQFRAFVDPSKAMTLDDFRDTVIRHVEENTRRKQHPFCYFPDTISPQALLFEAVRP